MQGKIGPSLQIQVHLKLCDETPFIVRPYPIREEQKSIVKREMDHLDLSSFISKKKTTKLI